MRISSGWMHAVAFAIAVSFAVPAIADDAPGQMKRVPAVIKSADPKALQATTADGKSLTAHWTEDAKITRSVKAKLSDVKPGQFIGCTAVEGADKKLVAQEIHILPENMRGAGEGHYPWGDKPSTTMTNGNVTALGGTVAGTSNKVLKVTYKGGESEIHVPADVPVTRVETVGMDALKPGTAATLYLTDRAGQQLAEYVSIESKP